MHDTAFKIGCLAMDIYSNLKTAKVLEIGSLNVNGSLRDHARDCPNYIGVDMEAGPDVDVVVTPGATLPFEDETFDLVMASSVFEHDPAFWRTFVEMCRTTRKGGYIYINAPSNGTFHRYPEDHWRFYPDSGMALARWAQAEGQDITLVESFVADRITEVYNDFAAVFRKGPTKKPLGKTFIYQNLICYNVRTWQSDELIHQRDASEDMVLISRYLDDIAALRTEVGTRDSQIHDLHQQLGAEQAKSQQISTERCVMEQLLHAAEQRALFVSAKVDETLRSDHTFKPLWESSQQELAALRKSLQEAEVSLAEARAGQELEARTRELTVDHLKARLADSEREAASAETRALQLENERAAQRSEAAGLRDSLKALQDKHAEALATLDRRHAATVTELAETKAGHAQTIQACQAEISLLQQRLAEADAKLRGADHDAKQALGELSQMRGQLAAAEAFSASCNQHAAELASQIQWLRTACQVLLSQRSSLSWPSSTTLQARRDAELHRRQMFNAQAYLANNPDVAATGIDPLLHFILHGMAERRAPL